MDMVFAGVLAALMAFAPELTTLPAGGQSSQAGVELVAGNPPIANCLPVATGNRDCVCRSAGNRFGSCDLR
jgi:hypothetical protein